MITYSNNTMEKVEQMVCDCVNTAMSTIDRETVSVEDLYVGKKNIPFGRAMARNFVLDILHNKYGYSYNVIAQRSDMTQISVMRCVRKCHQFMQYDKSYFFALTLINDKFREWYGEE